MTFQINTSLLDACVLALLSKEDIYGYLLTQNVKEVINVSESTLYPVLRRLKNESFLTVYDAPFDGRNRRYYQITDLGKSKLAEYRNGWNEYKTKVDRILLERNTVKGLSGGDGIEQA